MLTQDPVRIPDMPGKISFVTVEGKEYVRYLISRKYNPEKKYTEQERVIIGRRCREMPGLMYPNDNYEQHFNEKENEAVSETMTQEEEKFIRKDKTYKMFSPFFDALYYEFRVQARKSPDGRLNRYKTESLNRVLKPLKEMMQDEEYAQFLGLAEEGKEDEKSGMSHADAMFLLIQYKCALSKYHWDRVLR